MSHTGMGGAAALRIISRISLECDRTGNPLCLGNILVLTGRPLFRNPGLSQTGSYLETGFKYPKSTYGPCGYAWFNFRVARHSSTTYETFSGVTSDTECQAVPFACRRAATSLAA